MSLHITNREREVLHLIAHEKTSKEIANQLYICPETVNSHRRNIMSKMKVKNTAGMVRVGMERGLVSTLMILFFVLYSNLTTGQLSYVVNNDPNHNGEIYTGESIDLHSLVLFSCGDSMAITYSFSAGINAYQNTVIQQNSELFYSLESISSNEVIISSIPGYIQSVINNSDGYPYSTDIYTRLFLEGGSLCIDDFQTLEQTVQVFQEGELCATYSDLIEIQPKWREEQYSVEVDLLTNESDLCYGGFAKYRVRVHHSQLYGGSNLYDPYLISVSTNAEIINFINASGQSLSFGTEEVPFNNTDCTTWDRIYLPDLYSTSGFSDFYAILNIACEDCDPLNDLGFGVLLFGQNSCDAQFSTDSNDEESFVQVFSDNNCCGTPGNGSNLLNKIGYPIDPDNSQFTPNACYQTYYDVVFDNTLSGNSYSSFEIIDELPDNFDLNRISLLGNFPSAASIGINYQNTFLHQSGNTIEYVIHRSDGSIEPEVDLISSVGNLSNPGNPIAKIEFKFNGTIRPWIEFIGIRFEGKLTSDAIPGTVLTNTATAYDNNNIVAGPSPEELTVKSDNPYIDRRTLIIDDNGYVLSSPSYENGDKFTALYRIQNLGGAPLSINDQFSASLPSGLEFCSEPTFYLGANNSGIYPNGDFSITSPLNGNYSFSSDMSQFNYENFDDLESSCLDGKYFYIKVDIKINETATGGNKSINGSMPELSNSELGHSLQASLNVIRQYITSPSISASCSSNCEVASGSTVYMSPGKSGFLFLTLNNASNHSLTDISFDFSHTQPGDYSTDCLTLRNSEFSMTYGTPILCNDPVSNIQIGSINLNSNCGSFTEISFSGQLSAFTDIVLKIPITVSNTAAFGQKGYADFRYKLTNQSLLAEVPLLLPITIEIVPNSCGEPITPENIDCELFSVSSQAVDTEVGDCCKSITIQQPYSNLINSISLSTTDGENIDYWAIAGSYNMNLLNGMNDTLKISPFHGESFIGTDDIQLTICINEFYSFPQELNVTFEMSDEDETINVCTTGLPFGCTPEEIGSSFTKYYGDSLDNYITHIEPIGNFIYLSGSKQVPGDVELYATFSKLDFFGNLIWEHQIFDFPSLIIDFEEKDNDEIIIVGRSSPSGTNINNKSFLAVVSKNDGSILESKIYDNSGREFFRSIVSNPNNIDAPFYILGQKNTLNGGTADDVFVVNLDNQLNENWNKKIEYSSDDQMSNWMSLNLQGDLILAGSDGSTGNGIIVIADKDDGSIIDAVSTGPFHFHYSVADNGFGYIVSSQDRNDKSAFISFYDYQLELVNSIKLEDQDLLLDISFASNGDFYGIGRKIDNGGNNGGGLGSAVNPNKGSTNKSASTFPVINRFKFNFPQNGNKGSIYFHEAKNLTIGDSDYGAIDLFASTNYGQIFHASSRKRTFYPVNSPSYSHWDALIASFDLDLSENCLAEYTPSPVTFTYTFTEVNPSSEDYTLPIPERNLVHNEIQYTCENPCLPDCFTDFTYTIDERLSCTGQRLIFQNLSTDNLGEYVWIFGDGSHSTESDPSHFFDGPGTYRVCLSALECTSQTCKYIDIDIPSQALNVACALPDFISIPTEPGECFAHYMVPEPIYQNAFCILSTFNRSDGLTRQDAYPIGTTTTFWEVYNHRGDTVRCNFDVIVVDNQAPVLTCPNDIEVSIRDYCTPINLPEPLVSENCEYSITYNYPSDFCFPLGTTEVTIRVSDGENDPVYCSFNIIVHFDDSIPSLASCESNIVLNGDLSTIPPSNSFHSLENWDAIFKFPNSNTLSSPQVISNDGCQETGCFQIWGNQVVGEGIYQMIDFNPGYSYNFSFCAREYDSGYGSPQIRVRAVKETTTVTQKPPVFGGCDAPECQEVVLTDILDSYWDTYSINDWIPQEEYDYIAITVSGPSDQDDPNFLSWARIDDICITETLLPCPEDLIINKVMNGPELYKSFNEIQTDSRIATNSNIRLTATQSTTLRQNFEVVLGSELSIDNEGCEEDCTYECLSSTTASLAVSNATVSITASKLVDIDPGCEFTAKFNNNELVEEMSFSCENQGANSIELSIFSRDEYLESCTVIVNITDEFGVCGF